MKNSLSLIVILLILFIWANHYHGKLIWKWIDNVVYYVEEFYDKALNPECITFPQSEITMYRKCESSTKECKTIEPVCETKTITPASNIVNVSCGTTNSSKETSCLSKCKTYKEIIYKCYKYVLDVLPGIIHKYKLDTCKQPIEETHETILHNLGILNKIYIESNNIVVEDSYSTEYIATFDPLTGNLIF